MSGVYVGALDIGGTKIAAALVDETGRVLSRSECPTAPERGFEDAIARMRTMLAEACAQSGVRMAGIGIGCTGPVDPFSGLVGDVDFMPSWRGKDLAGSLFRAFSVPTALENDADADALGEARWGASKGKSRLIYVTVGTGIGSGMVFDGVLYRGANGAHPEVAHLVIEASGPPCYCGARGCWEALAGGPAMAAWANAQRRASAIEGPELTGAQICELAQSGDRLAREAVEREGWYLGVGIANLVSLYAPDAIVLGGGVVQNLDLYLETIWKVIRTNCKYVPYEHIEIGPSSLGPDAALIGAAQTWFHRYQHSHAS
ncbi:MAG: ROK family protein [Bryobacteraceae bacterium]|nr:ROK family protein [Bryobacteraceae bacterium]